MLTLFFNLVVARNYNQLYQNNIIHTGKRVSFKILNEALKTRHELKEIEMIVKCKKYYTLYIILFYISVLLMAVTIYLAIP